MRVNQIQQPASVEQVQNTAPTDGSFKFMLASHVEEAELQERLTNLMAEITTEGEKLAKKRDVKDMRHYRGLVKEFLNEVVTRSHSFSRENFLDRRGRHRVYGIIRLVDENLDQLAQELMKDEKRQSGDPEQDRGDPGTVIGYLYLMKNTGNACVIRKKAVR